MGVLTQAELKRRLYYNPETGIFTWAEAVGNRHINSLAGAINRGYVTIGINRKNIRAHRLAWLYVYGEFPKGQLDHINGIRNDNRITNLREATGSQNNFNSVKRKQNSSGYKGVFYISKGLNKWKAEIRVHHSYIYLGSFNTPEEASEAYQTAARKYHGDFYREPT